MGAPFQRIEFEVGWGSRRYGAPIGCPLEGPGMERTLRVLNELERDGVVTRYAIGGGMGALFYMEPFLTYDLDVFVELSSRPSGLATLERLYEALKQRGYGAEDEYVSIEGVPVQFLPTYNPLLEEALAEARETRYGTTPTRVLRPEHLAAIMVQTGREKDRQRLVSFVAQAEIDRGYLEQVLARYELTDRWSQWTGSQRK